MDTTLGISPKFPFKDIEKWVPYLLAVSLLALPISSTGKSACLGLTMVAILLVPRYRLAALSLFENRWCKAALALFSLAIITSLWSPANFSTEFLIIEKYSKLLYLPLLVVAFYEERTRNLGLHAFILAMFITCSIAILRFWGYLPHFNINPDHVFRNHIMTGFMVAFGAYLCVLFCYRQKNWLLRLVYSFVFYILSYEVLFINMGRTGYVIYFLLMGLFLIQVCSWRVALAGILFVGIVSGYTYLNNPVMKGRINLAIQEFKKYKKNEEKDTPTGYRLQFHQFAYKLFLLHPLIGNGTGSFFYYFKAENPVPSWAYTLLEPHSQYWLTVAEFGIIGLFVLFLFYFYLIKASLQLDKMRPIALAMLIPFFIGNLTDSLMFYSGSGYFFIMIIALCLGEKVHLQDKLKSKDTL